MPVSEPVQLHLTKPVAPFDLLYTEDGAPIGLMIADPESATMKAFDHAITNSRIMQGRKGAMAAVDATLLEEQAKQRIACSIVGFVNVTVDGNVLDWSPAAARTLIDRFPWIRQQVDEFLGNSANFIKIS